MRLLLICLALLMPATALQAQQDERSRLVQLIEGALSDGEARQVRIEGFSGSLSSTASLKLLTITDSKGVWLRIEDAELEWRPSALVRGTLDIQKLKAARIVLHRAPSSDPGPKTPEATPFALPDLPVSLSLETLAIDRIELGETFMGFAATASLKGNASLNNGTGTAALTLDRLDGPTGQFDLNAAYSNATSVLDLALSLVEDSGGITSTALGIPGVPSVALKIAGSGPIDDLNLALKLTTDGVPRIEGALISGRDPNGAHQISTRIAGDIATLVLPEHQAFFGPETLFEAMAILPDAGGFKLEKLRLTSQSLFLEGMLEIASDNMPLRFDLKGKIEDRDGASVRLPFAGTQVRLANAQLALSYDSALDNGWDGRLQIRNLQAGAFEAESSDLTIQGQILPPGLQPLAITANLQAQLDAMSHTDPQIANALGDNASLSLTAEWQDGAPLQLREIAANNGAADLLGEASFETGTDALLANLDLQAKLPDIALFSDLVDSDLAGMVVLRLNAEAELLSGAFKTAAQATAQDLRLGSGLPPALLAGETKLAAELRRDTNGVHLDRLELNGAALSAQAKGQLSSAQSHLRVEAGLASAAVLTTALSGPITAELELSRATGEAPWNLSGSANGQGGIATSIEGAVGLPNATVDLALNGSLPLAITDPFTAPNALRGTARFDLRLAGPPALSSVSGSMLTNDARLTLPSAGLALQNIDLKSDISAGNVAFKGGAAFQAGGQMRIDGKLDLLSAGLSGQVNATLNDVLLTHQDILQTTIERASINVSGPMAAGPQITGQINLGQTDVVLEGFGFGTAEPIPDIRHVGASNAQTITRKRAGLEQSRGGSATPVQLDLTVSAPSRIFLRGNGLDAELGGSIRLSGRSDQLAPSGQFELIRGRLSFLGRRFDISEASASLRGNFDPFLRIAALTKVNDITAQILIEGLASKPELRISAIPDLPQDEVLAQLFFGRSANGLSALQALQLVDAVSSFSGGQSLIGNLRNTLGVDDLDLSTNAQGEASLRVGRYLSENVYSDAEIQANGDAEVSLNLDLTPEVTVRGGVSSDGGSGVGVFFERDY